MKQENSPPAQIRHSALCLHFELSTTLCLQFHVIPWKHGCAAPGTEGSRGRLWHNSTSTRFGTWQTPAQHWKGRRSWKVREVSLDNTKLQVISPYPSSSHASVSQAPGSAGLHKLYCFGVKWFCEISLTAFYKCATKPHVNQHAEVKHWTKPSFIWSDFK